MSFRYRYRGIQNVEWCPMLVEYIYISGKKSRYLKAMVTNWCTPISWVLHIKLTVWNKSLAFKVTYVPIPYWMLLTIFQRLKKLDTSLNTRSNFENYVILLWYCWIYLDRGDTFLGPKSIKIGAISRHRNNSTYCHGTISIERSPLPKKLRFRFGLSFLSS